MKRIARRLVHQRRCQGAVANRLAVAAQQPRRGPEQRSQVGPALRQRVVVLLNRYRLAAPRGNRIGTLRRGLGAGPQRGHMTGHVQRPVVAARPDRLDLERMARRRRR